MQGDDNDYVAQVWQAVLARAPEIIFWCAGQLHPPTPAADVYPHLRELMPAFDRVAGMLDGRARGIPIHLPIGSVGEYNVFGYFGMIGLPMEPVTSVPAGGPTTIFTLHSLRQEGLARLVLDRLEAGKNVLLTWPLLDALRQSELGSVVNVINEGAPVSSATFRFRETRYRYDTAQATHPIAFPRLEVSTWPGVRDIALVREDADFGVLLNEPYLDSVRASWVPVASRSISSATGNACSTTCVTRPLPWPCASRPGRRHRDGASASTTRCSRWARPHCHPGGNRIPARSHPPARSTCL
jgi:hypothetical protein